MREGPRGIEDAERGLVLAVGGDTLSGIALLMQGKEGERPLSLDLLWTVLQRGRQLSKRDWSLQRVAIVELRGSAYIGRLFFGGEVAGSPAWDCDCRPSDGCWLSLKVGACWGRGRADGRAGAAAALSGGGWCVLAGKGERDACLERGRRVASRPCRRGGRLERLADSPSPSSAS